MLVEDISNNNIAVNDSEDESEYESDEEDCPFFERVSDRLHPTFRTMKVYTSMTLTKTGSLAWMLVTSFLLLGFPIAVSLEREASLIELDKQLKGQGAIPIQ